MKFPISALLQSSAILQHPATSLNEALVLSLTANWQFLSYLYSANPRFATNLGFQGEVAVAKIREAGNASLDVKLFYLDLGSLESVKKFAGSVQNVSGKIDILVNNAGGSIKLILIKRSPNVIDDWHNEQVSRVLLIGNLIWTASFLRRFFNWRNELKMWQMGNMDWMIECSNPIIKILQVESLSKI